MADHEIAKREQVMNLFRIDSVPTKFFSIFNHKIGDNYLRIIISAFVSYGEKKILSGDLNLANINSKDSFSRNLTRKRVGDSFQVLLKILVGSVGEVCLSSFFFDNVCFFFAQVRYFITFFFSSLLLKNS